MKLSDCKPGVRVAAYDSMQRAVGEIHFINSDGLIILRNTVGSYHPKQLRKLKPKENEQEPPKELWVNLYFKDNEFSCAEGRPSKDADLSSFETPLNNRAYKYRLVGGE